MCTVDRTRGGHKLLLVFISKRNEKVFDEFDSWYSNHMVDTMESESHSRPRRSRHDSSKHYDSERKDLELSQVLNVLQRYVDYGGGINCCVCGKLYKSRVCFIKHLWEHTIYWDMFAGDKNHMRVLSIQAALILYGSCQRPQRPIPVDNLLVTSPHCTDSNDAKSAHDAAPCISAKPAAAGQVPCSVGMHREGVLSARDAAKMLPSTPEKMTPVSIPKTPKKKIRSDIRSGLKRKNPPKLDLSLPPKKSAVGPGSLTPDVEQNNSHSPQLFHVPSPVFHTPVKQRIPCILPRTPQKKKYQSSRDTRNPARRVSRFIIPATASASDQYWKDTDSCVCKRKRSE